MSKSDISLLKLIGQQIAIYGGISVLIIGVSGSILNLIIFLTLRTFRQSSCAFYLIIMSIFNIGQLLTGLLSRTLLYITKVDETDNSLFYCKFRLYFSHICVMISLTCFCLATIDQYCATSPHRRLRQLCTIKVARCLIIIFSLIWILHGIPYAVLSHHSIPSVKGQVSCTMTNEIYIAYRTYFILFILIGFLPLSTIIFFGLIAYDNIKKIPYYTVPLVRRELDKQLTKMVLVQAVVNIFILLPYTIANIISLNMENNHNAFVRAQVGLAAHVTLIVYYLYYANSFYIYICASERFRRQLMYVLFKIYLNRWERQPRIAINQIMPQ